MSTTYIGEPFIEHCPQCAATEDLRPIAKNVLLEREEALCLYRCGRCRHQWMTSYDTGGEDPRYLTSDLARLFQL